MQMTYRTECERCECTTLHLKDGAPGHVHAVCLRCGHAPCCGGLVPCEVTEEHDCPGGISWEDMAYLRRVKPTVFEKAAQAEARREPVCWGSLLRGVLDGSYA